MRRYSGYLFILLAAVCWGLIGPSTRFALADGFTSLEVAFWRAAIACMFFFLHCARAGTLKVHSPRDLGAFGLFGVIAIASFFACYQYAVQTGGVALASVLLYTAPAWVALFSRIVYAEGLTGGKLAAIAMVLGGVILISLSGAAPAAPPDSQGALSGTDNAAAGDPAAFFPLAGVFFGLMSGLLYSTHFIFTKKYLNRYTAFTIYGYGTFFATLSMLPFVSFSTGTATGWAALLFLGLVCTYAGYWAYCEGLKRLAPTRAAVLATLEPVVATATAWWLWDERFTTVGWVGAALVVGAVLVLVLEHGRTVKCN